MLNFLKSAFITLESVELYKTENVLKSTVLELFQNRAFCCAPVLTGAESRYIIIQSLQVQVYRFNTPGVHPAHKCGNLVMCHTFKFF